jgi:DNA-binding NarL/FixJ family response regulator
MLDRLRNAHVAIPVQNMKTITVLLADDHDIVRQGFRALLKAEKGIEVIGEAETGRIAVEITKELQPDVVVMDIAMPYLNGMEAARQIRSAVPTTQVLILSAYSSDDYVDRVMSVGATGYLLKQSSATLLVKAIRTLGKGEVFYDPAISSRLLASQPAGNVNGADKKKPKTALSPREGEILQLIAEGAANKQIADILSLSIKTVEKIRQRLMDKLHIHNTAGLTRYALSKGVIEDGVQVTKI